MKSALSIFSTDIIQHYIINRAGYKSERFTSWCYEPFAYRLRVHQGVNPNGTLENFDLRLLRNVQWYQKITLTSLLVAAYSYEELPTFSLSPSTGLNVWLTAVTTPSPLVGAKWWWGALDGHHSAITSNSLVKVTKKWRGLVDGSTKWRPKILHTTTMYAHNILTWHCKTW